ncbi:DNA-binding HxlR family transcriptional regulator [Rhodanobacter sp. ANJX3]|uniref:winged helix-turn-helix transcriptional regulator n=1 Tax=unclassified Rhodanobacter TaxID=2621553 RepID=UPI0015CE2748|nr:MULTISPECIES: helix-turn-helix domain-containing protein [unclassified Rhodanobacter]MBB5360027.1 DNA-binding HxlR family transcriptional regulator [Rhodanobacter sp. ANJX3]NYE28955.1 DNA-binding HxlR family transcriptional regulator [Rhodanobacter sp. K2T2]
MRSNGFEGMVCSIATVLSALGDRWGALIVRDLFLGLSRFDDLKRSTGITNATLSDRLKALEKSKLIERRCYQSRPDRYEYLLTAKGWDLGLVMQAMVQVGDKWSSEIGNDPPLCFVDARSGRHVKLATVFPDTGKAVSPSGVKIQLGPGADELMKWRLAPPSVKQID